MKKPLELPPAIANGFVKDMRDFFAEDDATKRDAIAAHQLGVLRDYEAPRSRQPGAPHPLS